jgi:hypothetical protein
VEECLETVLQSDSLIVAGILRDGNLQKSFPDNLVIILNVRLSGMIDVHLHGYVGQIERLRNEAEGFGSILMMKICSFWPTTPC